MAFGEDIDTLNLLFDKLQYIFSGYNPIRESFLEMNDLYKQNKISEGEFFEKLHESINRFSALEFLLIKAIFEIKKTMRSSGGPSHPIPQVQGRNMQPSSNSLASFIPTNNLSRSELSVSSVSMESNICTHCGTIIKKLSNFCTRCGNKLQ